MKRFISILFLPILSSGLYGYSDADMDGVEDTIDKCPNTPLTNLVDINGCTKSKVKIKIKKKTTGVADIIVGIRFSSFNDSKTYSNSLQLDYYYGNFSLKSALSYSKTFSKYYNKSSLNDSFISGAYRFTPLKHLSLRLSIGALLPTYKTSLNNNKTDYITSTSLSYTLSKINFFGDYSYTLINDTNRGTIRYQNTNTYNLGVGYYCTDRLYISASYNLSNSMYKGNKDIKNSSLYGYYNFNKKVFFTLSYAYGLSDTANDNALSLKVGYYF